MSYFFFLFFLSFSTLQFKYQKKYCYESTRTAFPIPDQLRPLLISQVQLFSFYLDGYISLPFFYWQRIQVTFNVPLFQTNTQQVLPMQYCTAIDKDMPTTAPKNLHLYLYVYINTHNCLLFSFPYYFPYLKFLFFNPYFFQFRASQTAPKNLTSILQTRDLVPHSHDVWKCQGNTIYYGWGKGGNKLCFSKLSRNPYAH